MKSQKSVVLKRSFKNLMSTLLPIAKKVISKSRIMQKIQPNKIKNTLKRVSNREIKSLENIINTSKIVIEKPPIATKPKIISKPKIIDKSEIVVQKT